jgi:hypothetical protein
MTIPIVQRVCPESRRQATGPSWSRCVTCHSRARRFARLGAWGRSHPSSFFDATGRTRCGGHHKWTAPPRTSGFPKHEWATPERYSAVATVSGRVTLVAMKRSRT